MFKDFSSLQSRGVMALNICFSPRYSYYIGLLSVRSRRMPSQLIPSMGERRENDAEHVYGWLAQTARDKGGICITHLQKGISMAE